LLENYGDIFAIPKEEGGTGRGHFKFELVFLANSQNFGELLNSPDHGDISRVFGHFKLIVSQLILSLPACLLPVHSLRPVLR
jgi:hypothetical protein